MRAFVHRAAPTRGVINFLRPGSIKANVKNAVSPISLRRNPADPDDRRASGRVSSRGVSRRTVAKRLCSRDWGESTPSGGEDDVR